MTIKKKYLASIFNILSGVKTNFENSRIRNRFLNKIMDEQNIFKKELKDIALALCDKDKDGKPKIDENGHYVFSGENLKQAEVEHLKLLSEEVTIDTSPVEIKVIKNLIETGNYNYEEQGVAEYLIKYLDGNGKENEPVKKE